MAIMSDTEALIWRLENAIETQRASIGRLLEHLSFHHDELGQVAAEQCTYLREQWKKEKESNG